MTRAVCDSCESAPAVLFCAADEAALCEACDQQVHGCNKLASRHIRLVLKESHDVPKCDICENAPAFFFCGIDGTSLCLQCDMDAHVGGKRTHERYILIKQKVELPSVRKEAIEIGNEDHQKSPFFDPSYAENNPQKEIAQRNMKQYNMPNVRALYSCEEDQPQGYWRVSPPAIDLNSNPTTSSLGEPSDNPMSSQVGEHSFNQELGSG